MTETAENAGAQQTQDWVPDVLGLPFEQLTLPLDQDAEGDVVATLVRLLPEHVPGWRRLLDQVPPLDDTDVLYVHGWSDYFFQKRLARFFADRGARFFALDLRKYGRSLRDGQTPGFTTDLATYDEDIAAALAAMGWDPDEPRDDRRLVLLGHSTGGLTLSLWASRHPGYASALVLNSPWLALQLSALTRAAVAPLIQLTAQWAPMEAGPQLDLGFYARAQQEVADPDDPVDVNHDWRPEHAMAVHAGWLHAIVQGQSKLKAGLGIDAPVTVLLSTRSVMPTKWSDALTAGDSVLVVDDIAVESLRLGPTVTVERIDGALHDVFLSRHEAREDAYARLARFADVFAIGRREPRRWPPEGWPFQHNAPD